MFPADDIKRAYGVAPVRTPEMAEAISLWMQMFAGSASWCDEFVKSLHVEAAIVREFADITLNEMNAAVDNDKLNKILTRSLRNLNAEFRRGLASGALIIKPLGGDHVQYVAQDKFVPVKYDSFGRLTSVIFPDRIKRGENAYLTRLEYHDLSDGRLTICNKAFYSGNRNELGREINLDTVPEWSGLLPEVTYPSDRPIYGYYKNPNVNTIDGSAEGVSIFEPAVDLIRKTDMQFGRLDWEFESGERAIYASPFAIEPKYRDGKKSVTPKLNKRLFRALDIDNDNNDFYKEFSPVLRQSDIISGLDEYKRNIEFAVGLSYGDLSNPQSVDKTATEIKAAKQRKYNTVTAIQNNLRDCLDDLVYALAFHNAMTKSGYEFTCTFNDSILTDEATERAQDERDIANGIMRPEEYRAKWYGETIEAALANLPESTRVIE